MSKNTFGQRRKQLKVLAKKLQALLASSAGEITVEAQVLMRRIRTLIQEIRGLMSRRELSRILGAAAIFFGLGMNQYAGAQNFDNPVADPFGITPSNYVNIPTAVDIDGDGDLDILAGAMDLSGYYGVSPALQFHENTGTAQMPQFAAPVNDTFGIDLSVLNSYVVLPTFGDLDGDGDQDLLMGGSYKGLFYYENTGTAQSPSFAAPQDDPFGLSDSVYYGSPILLDLDNDGDLDLLSGEYDGRIVYYENIGTPTAPAFGTKQYEPFGLQTSYYAFPTAGDVDWDGDLDLIIGDYYGDMHYFQNTGSKTNPQFAAPVTNPSNIMGSGYISFPMLADIDGDSDPDFFVGEGTYYSGIAFNFYENLATGISITEVESGVNIYPTLVKSSVLIDSEIEFSSIQLVSSTGTRVLEFESEDRRLNLSDLAPGPYILELYTEDRRLIKRKLIKE